MPLGDVLAALAGLLVTAGQAAAATEPRIVTDGGWESLVTHKMQVYMA